MSSVDAESLTREKRKEKPFRLCHLSLELSCWLWSQQKSPNNLKKKKGGQHQYVT